MFFPSENFMHLTGVNSSLSPHDFYANTRRRKLELNQFYFDQQHFYKNAKKKLHCLKRLSELTTGMVCILKELKTLTVTYKLSVSNLEFTLCLIESDKHHGSNGNKMYVPKSLRVEDSSVERSNGGEIVDFIFCKDYSAKKYDSLLVKDIAKDLPDCIKDFVCDNLFK